MGKVEFITEMLHSVFKSYQRTFDQSFADMWIKALGRFEENIVRRVCEKWVSQQLKPPLLSQLVENCKRLEDYMRGKASTQGADTVCRYRSDTESQFSKDLCSKVTPADAQVAAVNGWPSVCGWHFACMQAKTNPEGSAACMVKHALEAMREMKASSGGENEYFLKTLGFNPFDPDPQKKEDAGRIREAMAKVFINVSPKKANNGSVAPDKLSAGGWVAANDVPAIYVP
jgi:hypothetical protein